MSTVSLNKSQTSGHNGLSPVGLRPLFRPEVCDLFADTVLKPRPLLLQHCSLDGQAANYQGSSRGKPLFYTFPVNKVANTIVTKSKQLNHRPCVNGVKHSHNDTVSTRNRFQVLENLNADDIEVPLRSTFPSDTSFNSITSSPSRTNASTKVGKACKKFEKNHKNHSSTGESNTGEATTVMSDVSTQQSLSTVLDSKVDALPNIDHHLFTDSYLDPPSSDPGFESSYANTAIPLPVWENRKFCILIFIQK